MVVVLGTYLLSSNETRAFFNTALPNGGLLASSLQNESAIAIFLQTEFINDESDGNDSVMLLINIGSDAQ